MKLDGMAAVGAMALLACVSATEAGVFTAGNLVVMRVANDNPGGSGAVVLDEYTLSGTHVGTPIALPVSGPGAFCKSDLTNHDRHLHRSADGQYLAFVGYGRAPSVVDPAADLASVTPRVIGLLSASGNVDLSTRLGDTCETTGIRAATTTDGTQIWIAGDNASGATLSGGLRYCTRGASTSVNLSQVQGFGGARTSDNVRDVGLFAGQLYDSSGSNASIGKGLFRAGSGLPISGAQAVTAINTDGSSASGFAFLDLDASIPGPDVVYTASSSGGGVRKYVQQPGGAWVSRGFVLFAEASDVIAVRHGGSVTVYAGGTDSIVAIEDGAPLTSTIDGSTPMGIVLTAPAGYTLGGFDLAPVCAADFDGSGTITVQDIFAFLNAWFASDPRADIDHGGVITVQDIFTFLSIWFGGCP